eukprot:1393509-Ditylum_brightwellii.AAC.1
MLYPPLFFNLPSDVYISRSVKEIPVTKNDGFNISVTAFDLPEHRLLKAYLLGCTNWRDMGQAIFSARLLQQRLVLWGSQ